MSGHTTMGGGGYMVCRIDRVVEWSSEVVASCVGEKSSTFQFFLLMRGALLQPYRSDVECLCLRCGLARLCRPEVETNSQQDLARGLVFGDPSPQESFQNTTRKPLEKTKLKPGSGRHLPPTLFRSCSGQKYIT